MRCYLDGELAYDNQAKDASGISIDDIRELKMTIHEKLEALAPDR